MSANAPPNNGNGQIVPFKQKVNDLRSLLDGMKEQFQKALPKHFGVDRLLRLALTAVQKEPKLLECHRMSFLLALLECAQLGLEPNTSLGHAWLIPFRNNRANRLECQLIPGYKGLIKLAYQSGMVASIGAHVVRERDTFDYRFGLRPRLIHKPFWGSESGPMVAVYSVAEVQGMDRGQFNVLQRWECEGIRDRFSASPRKGPWVDNFDEMSMKSSIRRLVKFIPSDTEKNFLARAVSHDERAEAGISQEFDNVIELGPEAVGTLGEPQSEEPGAEEPQPEGQPGDKPSEGAPVAEAQPAATEGTSKLDKLVAEKKAQQARQG